MIDALHQKIKTTGAFDLAREIADKSGLYAFYKDDTSIEGQARFANVEELVNSVAAFEEERRDEAEGAEDIFTLDDYLENVSLLSNVDLVDEDDTNNKVALMTVHSAKGLEFPYVFVAGMEENLFPSQSMLLSQKDIEEERRLFYVAITRAGKAVSLSYAGTRMRNGRHESNSPSRFLREIDSQYLDRPLEDDSFGVSGAFGSGGGFGRSGFAQSAHPSHRERWAPPAHVAAGGYARPPKPSSESRRPEPARSPISPVPAQSKPAYTPDPDFVPLPMTEFRVGQRIEHNRFGPGEILDITGTVPELKARVRFDTLGEKLLLLKYAKMRLEKK